MQAIFHGHSFVEIVEWDLRILIDPFVDGNATCDVTVDDLLAKKIDAIIVTHGHDDHIWCTPTLSKKLACPVITSYELGKYFQQELWLDNVSTHGVWWWVQYAWFHVKFFQALHGWWVSDMVWWAAGYTTIACGVIVTIWERVVYHAWDTWLFWDMKLLNEHYDIDIAFLPIWDRYTMWVDDAVTATSWILPKYAVPMHYNTREKIKADDMEFARRVMLDSYAVPKVLKPWQAVVIE